MRTLPVGVRMLLFGTKNILRSIKVLASVAGRVAAFIATTTRRTPRTLGCIMAEVPLIRDDAKLCLVQHMSSSNSAHARSVTPDPSHRRPYVSCDPQVIREDFTIEAYDILELHCELLAERMRLVTSQKDVPPDMDQAVCTIIWAADRAEVCFGLVSSSGVLHPGAVLVGAQDINWRPHCFGAWTVGGRL